MSKTLTAKPRFLGYRLKAVIEHEHQQSIVPDVRYKDLLKMIAQLSEEQLEDTRMLVRVTKITNVNETEIRVLNFSSINFLKVYQQLAPYA